MKSAHIWAALAIASTFAFAVVSYLVPGDHFNMIPAAMTGAFFMGSILSWWSE